MTIIVYDGNELAIDNAGIHEGTKVPMIKSWSTPTGEIITGTGNAAQLALMRDWYAAGAKPEDFPASQSLGNPWCDLIVVNRSGLKRFENTPSAILHGKNKCAFGIGKDFAYGALAMGASASQAAAVALQYAPDTGHGIATFQWKDGLNGQPASNEKLN